MTPSMTSSLASFMRSMSALPIRRLLVPFCPMSGTSPACHSRSSSGTGNVAQVLFGSSSFAPSVLSEVGLAAACSMRRHMRSSAPPVSSAESIRCANRRLPMRSAFSILPMSAPLSAVIVPSAAWERPRKVRQCRSSAPNT